MASTFRVVFDLATAPDRWWNDVGWIFVLPLIGLLSLLIPEKVRNSAFYRGPKGAAAKVFGIAFFLLTGLISVYFAVDHFQQKVAYQVAQRKGQLSFAEGCLQNFHPMPQSGHDTERIDVAGHHFSYSDFDASSPAFNNSEAYGGPIHADSAVKIWYTGNNIIKLAVRDHACTSAPDLI
ncbi:MAG: hypothetical protein JWL96_1020 [Sphingomonas bacterium]|uniref:hypothetical protein n=1 Tax=Sphingomonas bacterium TaxID=1895847 RepID=UPI0026046D79|nr:hypothetical protein [Sphingomonas bacterium]MDB5708950.1 hypothetical protein [Sphingomonas bacterium]